jgi:hypothetical protein
MTLILRGTDNSVSAPAVQGGTAGTTTGEYFPAANQWAVATNGTQAILVDASQVTTLANALPVASGGTGQTTYTNGQLLIGNTTGNTLTKATLSAGTGISITNGTGSISIAATGGGTVTSVAATVPAFLSVTGSPITTSGTLAISLSGTALPVANGGTGVTTSTGATNVVLSNSPTIVTPTINTITSAASTALTLQSAGTTAVTVDTSQNVGIGTSSPIRKLTVSTSGTAEFVLQDTSQAANSRNWRIFNAGNTLYFGTLNDAGSSGTDAVKITSGANLQFNSGYGSVATAYGCRAWVMFNGSSGSMYGQGNVSSVTRNGTGNYVVNYSTAMPDANYSAVASCAGQGSTNGSTNCMLVNASAGGTNVTPTTTATTLFCYHSGNQVSQDTAFITFAVFR